MRVSDLLDEIERCRIKYPDFLNWDIYTEQIDEFDKINKRTKPCWKWLTDSDGWEYIECAGFWTKFEKEKVFTINVNF